jgi:hypothetical protein
MGQDITGIFPEFGFINRELYLELLDIYRDELAEHEDQAHNKCNNYYNPEELRNFKTFQIIHWNAHGKTGKYGKAQRNEQKT